MMVVVLLVVMHRARHGDHRRDESRDDVANSLSNGRKLEGPRGAADTGAADSHVGATHSDT